MVPPRKARVIGRKLDCLNLDCLMSVMQRFGHGRHQSHRFVERQRGLLEPGGEVRAVDVLEDDETRELVGAAHVIDRDDMRVVEAGDGAGLGPIGFGISRQSHQSGVRHLDSDVPVQLVVLGQVDPTEAALAQESLDAVAADVGGHEKGTPSTSAQVM
jgi:hypothetical protein